MACAHDHVRFTIPHALNDRWLANVAEMRQRLFASVHATVLALLGEGTYLGAKPGMIATLHTWSQTLLWHPHLHGLVTGGGLSEAGQWVAVSHGFLRPRGVVRAVFRGTRLGAIRRGVAQGTLPLPPSTRRQPMENRRNQLGRVQWHVPMRERSPAGQGVLVYLARYVRGGPMANRRLRCCDGQQVVFGYAERAKGSGGQARQGTMR